MGMKEIIKRHLDNMAQQDTAFAERYNSEDKNLDDCLKYITSQAKKSIKSGGGWLEDAVVFGWAVHYYQEDNKSLEGDIKNAPKSVKTGHVGGYTPKDVVKTETKKDKGFVTVKGKKEKKVEKCLEFDLFEGMF